MPKPQLYHGGKIAVGMLLAVGIASYPIVIQPMNNPEPWNKQCQKFRDQENIDVNKIQPGGMKIWTDPFDRPGKPGNR